MIQRFSLSVAIICLFFILGCGKKQHFPTEGDMYFRGTQQTKPEYIHMHFNNTALTGEIFMDEEVYGNVFYRFEGQVASDSVLKISIYLDTDPVSEEWIYRFEKKNLLLKNYLYRTDWVSYDIIEASQMPDTKSYASVEDILMDQHGEFIENLLLGCYENPSVDAADSNALYEYIQFNPYQIAGSGFGMEGDDRWHFNFSGTMDNDSLINMEVHYLQTGMPVFTTSETWTIDDAYGKLRRQNTRGKRLGGDNYRRTGCLKEVYFESTPPNAERKTTLYEYIKLTFKNNLVWGVGAGDFMEGSEPWTLQLHGTVDESNNMTLKVRYHQENKKPYTEIEVWLLDLKNRRLYRHDWAKSENDKGASEYHEIEYSEISNSWQEQMKNSIRP